MSVNLFLFIGGGIDGAIANFYLSFNFDVALVDKGRLGCCCTRCATALLEYQLDDYASDLEKTMSKEEIVQAYNMGLMAIQKISNFIEKYGNHCEFAFRPTFLFSNSIFSIGKLNKEYLFRKSHGFECELFDDQNNPLPFKGSSTIYSDDFYYLRTKHLDKLFELYFGNRLVINGKRLHSTTHTKKYM